MNVVVTIVGFWKDNLQLGVNIVQFICRNLDLLISKLFSDKILGNN